MPDELERKGSETTREPWADRAADLVVDLTDALREKGISPLYRITRWVIYGLVGGLLALVVGIALLIAVVRLLTVYAFASHVWITYLVLGAIFTIAGLVLWSKRSVKNKEQ